jgi:hypothetical protein
MQDCGIEDLLAVVDDRCGPQGGRLSWANASPAGISRGPDGPPLGSAPRCPRRVLTSASAPTGAPSPIYRASPWRRPQPHHLGLRYAGSPVEVLSRIAC